MFTGLDPTVQAALWGALFAAAIKVVDVLLGRADQARADRDEIRKDLDAQIKRRQDAEKDAEHAHELVKVLRGQLEDAENGARLAQQALSKFNRFKSEHELERERWRGDCRNLQDEIARLRRLLRESGISLTDALSRRDE